MELHDNPQSKENIQKKKNLRKLFLTSSKK